MWSFIITDDSYTQIVYEEKQDTGIADEEPHYVDININDKPGYMDLRHDTALQGLSYVGIPI